MMFHHSVGLDMSSEFFESLNTFGTLVLIIFSSFLDSLGDAEKRKIWKRDTGRQLFFSPLILKPSFMLTVNLLRHYKTVRQRIVNTFALLENGRKPKKIWIMLSFCFHRQNGNLNLLHQIIYNSQH